MVCRGPRGFIRTSTITIATAIMVIIPSITMLGSV